jgi:hypothetical protein
MSTTTFETKLSNVLDELISIPIFVYEDKYEEIDNMINSHRGIETDVSLKDKENFKEERNMKKDNEDELINSSILSKHIHEKLNQINKNTSNQNFNIKKLLESLRLSDLFNIPSEPDEILQKLKTQSERNKEIMKRFKQIDDAFNHHNLTFIDIIEILGNVQITDLYRAHNSYNK